MWTGVPGEIVKVEGLVHKICPYYANRRNEKTETQECDYFPSLTRFHSQLEKYGYGKGSHDSL